MAYMESPFAWAELQDFSAIRLLCKLRDDEGFHAPAWECSIMMFCVPAADADRVLESRDNAAFDALEAKATSVGLSVAVAGRRTLAEKATSLGVNYSHALHSFACACPSKLPVNAGAPGHAASAPYGCAARHCFHPCAS